MVVVRLIRGRGGRERERERRCLRAIRQVIDAWRNDINRVCEVFRKGGKRYLVHIRIHKKSWGENCTFVLLILRRSRDSMFKCRILNRKGASKGQPPV